MKTCYESDSIEVIDGCTLLTSAQWQSTPGTCRLRIKNFNPADWAGQCAGCTASGLPAWDGTFSQFQFVAPFHYYNIGNGFSIGGKTPFGAANIFNDLGIIGGAWFFEIACDNGGGALQVWIGSGPLVANPPTGIYTRSGGCMLNATFEIEAYSP